MKSHPKSHRQSANNRIAIDLSTDLFKYTDDKWLARRSSASWLGVGRDRDATPSTNHSVWSVHSCAEEKNRVLRTLTQYGIETTVDRMAKKQRIRDWILHSSGVYRHETAPESTPSASNQRQAFQSAS